MIGGAPLPAHGASRAPLRARVFQDHDHDIDSRRRCAFRRRKLLLHGNQLQKLYGAITQKGYTIIPTRMYFKNGHVKVALGLAKGKQAHDKRETIKRREADRETRAAVKERRR